MSSDDYTLHLVGCLRHGCIHRVPHTLSILTMQPPRGNTHTYDSKNDVQFAPSAALLRSGELTLAGHNVTTTNNTTRTTNLQEGAMSAELNKTHLSSHGGDAV